MQFSANVIDTKDRQPWLFLNLGPFWKEIQTTWIQVLFRSIRSSSILVILILSINLSRIIYKDENPRGWSFPKTQLQQMLNCHLMKSPNCHPLNVPVNCMLRLPPYWKLELSTVRCPKGTCNLQTAIVNYTLWLPTYINKNDSTKSYYRYLHFPMKDHKTQPTNI